MPAPANDNIANAITLAPNTTSTSYNSVGATKEAGEQGNANSTVWFIWFPKAAQVGVQQQIDTIGSGWDTYLGIFSGGPPSSVTVTNVTLVTQDDDAGGGGTSKCLFTPVANTYYYIQAGGFSTNQNVGVLNYPAPGSATLGAVTLPGATTVSGILSGGKIGMVGSAAGKAVVRPTLQRLMFRGNMPVPATPGLNRVAGYTPRWRAEKQPYFGGVAGPLRGPW